MCIPLGQHRGEQTPEDGAVDTSLGVDPTGESRTQPPHRLRNPAIAGSNQRVVVVVEQTEAMNLSPEASLQVSNESKEQLALRVVAEHDAASCAAVHDVMPRTRRVDSRTTTHAPIMTNGYSRVHRIMESASSGA